MVSPGDITVGDNDGIVVGCMESFTQILGMTRDIQKAEKAVKRAIPRNVRLYSMHNYEEQPRQSSEVCKGGVGTSFYNKMNWTLLLMLLS